MGQILCTFCESDEIIKVDDHFECRICGKKYSEYEYKKMVDEQIDVNYSKL